MILYEEPYTGLGRRAFRGEVVTIFCSQSFKCPGFVVSKIVMLIVVGPRVVRLAQEFVAETYASGREDEWRVLDPSS